MSNHIIHKQEVLLNVQNIDNAFSYQQTVSNLFANGLTQAIEQTLNEIDSPGKVTRINKLSLDLGEINATTFSDEFRQKIIQQLRASLESINDKTDVGVSVTKPSSSLREGFIFFIEKGILPWYIEAKNMAALETSFFDEWVENDWLFIVNWLRENAARNHSITERLAQQFSPLFLKKLVLSSLEESINDNAWQLLLNDLKFIYSKIDAFTFSSAFGTTYNNYLRVMLQLVISKNNISKFDEIIAPQLFQLFLINDEKHDLKTDGISSFTHVDSTKKKLAGNESDISAEQKNLLSSVHTKSIIHILKNIYLFRHKKIPLRYIDSKDLLETENYIIDKYASLKIDDVIMADNATIEKDDKAIIENANKVVENNIVQLKKAKPAKITEEDVLFVDNCGIVLLHPFLQAYFDGLLLTENKKFVSEDAQKRAILLLHYLSTGETDVAEFNLVMQKILSGFDIDETLPSAIVLLQNEIEESKKLLQSVIDYWPPLKNTSVEGLQATFLQRKGKLTTTDKGWQLTVEQKTVDILLGKLPWGFSTIKLPWMQGLLNVEWC